MSQLDHLRAAAVAARRALADAIMAGVAGVELRRAAMRAWSTTDTLLPHLNNDLPGWNRAQEWRDWSQIIALNNTIPTPLTELLATRHAEDEEP